ncbi:MAG TPA: RDD family protein [Micromonosporaceae bacterium]
MSAVPPGWYKDPVDPTTQRYWDGEGWIGEPLPADATPPPGPPPETPPPVPVAPEPPPQVNVPVGAVPWPTSGAPTPVVPPPGYPPQHPGTAPPSGPPPGGLPPGGLPPGAAWLPPGAQVPPGWYPHPYPAVPPPPRPHGRLLAPLGLRLVARLIDILAIVALNVVVNGWFAYQWWQQFLPFYREYARRRSLGESTNDLLPSERLATIQFMMILLAMAVWFAYEVPAIANTGQTLGKRLVGIQVVRLENEERIGFARAARRWNTMGLPMLLWQFGIGFLLQAVDSIVAAVDKPLHQALHDKGAQTVVVQVGRPSTDQGGPR